ncbi:MAG TPA: alkaline phosphatase family protein, partial [Candidatus Sulfotelmatobacter sp.]|nr:alkaline phosphatase family protein [Candidatus Sulfotelmatobacter sp.]
MRMMRLVTLACFTLVAAFAASPLAAAEKPAHGLDKVKHIIVIYLENRSFDNLYGLFPGANGLANAAATATQVDKGGQPYAVLPQPINTSVKPPAPDPRFPANLPNKPFDIDPFVPIDQPTGDLVHRFYQE